MKRLFHILMFCVAATLSASAAAWYVRIDGEDGEDGKSWDTAQKTIRLGIDNCRSGDTLFVEAGIYHEGIILKDGVTIIGGCTAFEPFDRRTRSHSAKTILDAAKASISEKMTDVEKVKTPAVYPITMINTSFFLTHLLYTTENNFSSIRHNLSGSLILNSFSAFLYIMFS